MFKAHNITQSMSGKGIGLDNRVMENFFGRLKTEMFFGETFAPVEDFKQNLKNSFVTFIKLQGVDHFVFKPECPVEIGVIFYFAGDVLLDRFRGMFFPLVDTGELGFARGGDSQRDVIF